MLRSALLSAFRVRPRRVWRRAAGGAILALALGLAAPPARAAGVLSQSAAAASATVAASVTAALIQEQRADTVAVQAQNQLARISAALQAMQNLQSAAHALALAAPSAVPDGLQTGGLVPDSGLAAPGVARAVTDWSNARTPVQSAAGGRTTVTIAQTASQAVLSWNSFNVGKATTVVFDQQGNTTWTALNRISASGVPSQILGSIQAVGHVYLIDPDGIIFGGASDVYVGSLVASSAALSTSQFLTDGIYSPLNGTVYAPSFTNAGGPILVQPGAAITTLQPAGVTTGGGLVLLLGSTVANGGTITTPDGQTELAAGDDFLLRPGYASDGNFTSTTRGDEVSALLDQPGSSLAGGAGTVQNSGLINSGGGDITLAGETVVQDGIARSTTTVAVRGTIHLLSSAGDPYSSVTLGANGLTLIAPDLASTATELDSQRAALIADSVTANQDRSPNAQFDDLSQLNDQQEDSRIEITTGGSVHFMAGSDSSAPGGQIAVAAVQRVQVDKGALLDVSGSTDVALPMSANDVAINIQNNELRDDPQNRLAQNLRSATVFVDTRTLIAVPASAADASPRDYTAGGLLEVSGYLANIGHTIGEYTAIGGVIDLSTGAKGAIVSQTGSVFDIDGGSLRYHAGLLAQSYLLGSDGRIYNVNDAPADVTYAGVYGGFAVDHPAWGVDRAYGGLLNAPSEIYQAGYTVGRAAGSLILGSPTTILDGAIHAAAVNGPAQIEADPGGVTDPYLLTQAEVAAPGGLYIETQSAADVAAIDSDVIFDATKAKAPALGEKIANGLKGETLLDAKSLDKSGLGTVQVVTDGSIDVAAPLTLAPGGTVALYGGGVRIAADITAPGGSVSAGQVAVIDGVQLTLGETRKNGAIVTGDTIVGDVVQAADGHHTAIPVTISTAGLWTNLLVDPRLTFTQAYADGGAVDLDSAKSLRLLRGSTIDSAAGGVIGANGVFRGGAGGDITLQAAAESDKIATTEGNLILRGRLQAAGYTEGGALTLEGPGFLLSDQAGRTGNSVLKLASDFFDQGFSAYDLISTGEIKVAAGTVVRLREPTYQYSPADAALPTGTPDVGRHLVLQPLYAPNAGYSAITQRPGASFSASIVDLLGNVAVTPSLPDGPVLSLGKGAVIEVDPGQRIALAATGQITLDGSLIAPGGDISAISSFNTGAALPAGPGSVSVWVGGDARLDVSGQPASFQNAMGDRIAVAPAGGSITLGSAASTAAVILRPGAALAASGSATSDALSPALDPTPDSGASPIIRTLTVVPIASAGGAIALASGEGIYDDATLIAAAGGATAAGGSLDMTLEADDVLAADGIEATPRIFTISQTDTTPRQPVDLLPGASAGLTAGTAEISQQQIAEGGFGSVTLASRDAFLFAGDVSLQLPQSLTLENGYYTDTVPTGSVRLAAPYVTLEGSLPDNNAQSQSFETVGGFSTQVATGGFTVDAGQIEIADAIRFGGQLVLGGGAMQDLAGFGGVALNSAGALQFLAPGAANNGTPYTNIVTTGDLGLNAAEIYAENGASALLVAGYDPAAGGNAAAFLPNGVLSIGRTAGSTPVAPDTLQGSLVFEAANIDQGGVIWQPLGQLGFGSQNATIGDALAGNAETEAAVDFLPGSLTSVSAAGLAIPFGGTTDGVTYDVAGLPLATLPGSAYALQGVTNGVAPGSIDIQALRTTIAEGAILDLRGGGTLSGAGFISGEGGSTDVLTTPLLSVTAAGVSQPAGDAVYAIVAGAQPVDAIAYTETGTGQAQPGLGQQIVIPAGVAGLPAGTYTLLPAYYALEPGGYRVEFDGAAALNAPPVAALPNGSYAVAADTALAGTAVRSSLASDLTLTPGAAVLNDAQYDQESYSAFLQAQAASIGAVRPVLPEDAGTLDLQLPADSAVALQDAGEALFGAASGGLGGTLAVFGQSLVSDNSGPDIDIYGAAPASGLAAGTVSLSSAQLDALSPFTLEIGAAGKGVQADVSGITLENGARLQAARVVLTALTGGITLSGGSTISTIGQGDLLVDSTTQGPLSNDGASVLDVANGYIVYGTSYAGLNGYGPITVRDGAAIYSAGSIAFSTSAAVTIGSAAQYGGRYIDIAVPEINIGDPQGLGAEAAPGVPLTEAALQDLAAGVPAAGVPATQILDLTAFDSLNFYGGTALDLSGSDVELEINTPAIYGDGKAGDVARIAASTIVWNGIYTTAANGTTLVSTQPGGILANGAGTGSGGLELDADTIVLGYSALDIPQRDVSLTRLAAGFSTVDLDASQAITANGTSSLAVYRSVPDYGAAGIGGSLELDTPLLTTGDAATLQLTAGEGIALAAPAGVGPATAQPQEQAGGEIDLTAPTLALASAVILPSGRLDLQASDGITLGAASRLDLAGAVTANQSETVYGFGGSLVMRSADGGITQDAGSVIDVGAVENTAGSVQVTAAAGQAALDGTLEGAAIGMTPGSSGSFTVDALGIGDFAALNAALDTGGFFASRNFEIGAGDLTIGDGVQAHAVTVSLDGGSLTVDGTIDASGAGGGSIALAATGGLTLAAGAVLEAQGTVAVKDSYGAFIAAENAPAVSLTSTSGTLTLAEGAEIDLASLDTDPGAVLGSLTLNAPRLGSGAASATDGQSIADPLAGNLTVTAAGPANARASDIAVSAPGRLDLIGADSIALDGFAIYANAPGARGSATQIVDQGYLDLIDEDSRAFENAALGNAALQARIAGLTAYGSAFHLRPGVTIASAAGSGDISVNGDLDLAGFRYGPDAGTDPAAADYGSGEPGVLEIRATGDLNVYGSITDGFAAPIDDKGTEFANGWVVFGSEPFGQNQVLPKALSVTAGSSLADTATVNFAVSIEGGAFQARAVAPVALSVAAATPVSVAFIATSAITGPGGAVLYAQGAYVPQGSVLPAGAGIAAGGSFPFDVAVGPVADWPANTPFTVLTSIAQGTGVVLADPATLPAGALIPGGSTLLFNGSNSASVATRATGADGSQGQLYGLASLLPAGDLSWSIGLVAGAESGAADPMAVQPGGATGDPTGDLTGNLTLADTHYGVQGGNIVPAYSVIRTGSGALSLIAAGDIDEQSSFGVYTAGTQSAAILNAAGQNPYDLAQGDEGGSTLLGAKNTALAALVANYQANYPTAGGDVEIAAGGDLNGFIFNSQQVANQAITNADAIGGWLWRQGGAGENGAWWTEYGSLTVVGGAGAAPQIVQYTGFQGIGTLGGGNLAVSTGGDASGLDLVVASNGRVLQDGGLLQEGGGGLTVSIGGAINPLEAGASGLTEDGGGVIADLRGDASLAAGAIGTILPQYGVINGNDIRYLSPLDSETADFADGIELAPGDGTVSLATRGDAVVSYVDDPGTVTDVVENTPVAQGTEGIATPGNGFTDFALWTPATAVDLFSAGGDVTPATGSGSAGNDSQQLYFPASLRAVSQNGDLYFGDTTVELLPAAGGTLELLAANSIIGQGSVVSMSGAPLSAVATPFDPGITIFDYYDLKGKNAGATLYSNAITGAPGSPIDFAADVPAGALHASGGQPAIVSAAAGDILNIGFGVYAVATASSLETVAAAEPFELYAGRDIVDSGTIGSPDIFLNLAAGDISSVTAGRDIIESSFDIAGPGALSVQAGRNYDAYGAGVIDSIGPVFGIDPANRNDGAAVSLIAGAGESGPDYAAFAAQFLNPQSSLGLQDAGAILADSATRLLAWLQATYGYAGSASGAYAYFTALSPAAQQVFLRQLYFHELDASGLEYNTPGSLRYRSYLLGRTAIAAFFPAAEQATPGAITMYGGSGIHTDFGGSIETLTPSGATTVGVEGTTPPASAGIITQGSGDIDMYALGSVELGESRVLTTFGGNIVIWSAAGDINAGRGSKTTIDYTPLQRLYDNYGDVFLSPSVPSSGAGIATLNPIPSVPPGDINLVAPQGTIDAGEAGIRSSGHTNLAALVVLNAANITSQQGTTGAPTAPSANVAGLSTAGNAAGAAAQAAQNSAPKPQAAQLPSIWIVEILGYGDTGTPTGGPGARKKGQRAQAI